ncbi:hypothetical protein ACWD00_02145 [Streptomyces viridiviolaceus]
MHTMTSSSAAGPTRIRDAQDDFLLQPPNPGERVPCRIDPVDLRRLDLHAILTAAGIAPSPGDHEAIEQLSRLPGSVHVALHRWLAGTRHIESATVQRPHRPADFG